MQKSKMINNIKKGELKIDDKYKTSDINLLNENIEKYDRHKLRTILRNYIRHNNRLLNYHKFKEVISNFDSFKNVFIIYANSFLSKNKAFSHNFRYSKIIKILNLNKKGKRLIYGDNFIKENVLKLNKKITKNERNNFLLEENKYSQQNYSNEDKKLEIIDFYYNVKKNDLEKLDKIIINSNLTLPTFSYFDIYLFSNNKKLKYEINKKNIKYIDINSVLYFLYVSVIIAYINLNDFHNAKVKFFEYIYLKKKFKKIRKYYSENEKKKIRISSLFSPELKSKIYDYYDTLHEKKASSFLLKNENERNKKYQKREAFVSKNTFENKFNITNIVDKNDFINENTNKSINKIQDKKEISNNNNNAKKIDKNDNGYYNINNRNKYLKNYKIKSSNLSHNVYKENLEDLMKEGNYNFTDSKKRSNDIILKEHSSLKSENKLLFNENSKSDKNKKRREVKQDLTLDVYLLFLKIKYKQKSFEKLIEVLKNIPLDEKICNIKKLRNIVNNEYNEKINMSKKERILRNLIKIKDKRYYFYNYFFDVLIYFSYFKQINTIEGLLVMALIFSKLNFINVALYIYKNIYLYFYYIFENYQKKLKIFDLSHEINKLNSFNIKENIDYLNKNIELKKENILKNKLENLNKKYVLNNRKELNDNNFYSSSVRLFSDSKYNSSSDNSNKNNKNSCINPIINNKKTVRIFNYILKILRKNNNFYFINDYWEENHYSKYCNFFFLNKSLNIHLNKVDDIVVTNIIKNSISYNYKYIFNGIKKHILIYLNLINHIETKYIFYQNNYNLKNIIYYLYLDKIIKYYDSNIFTYEKNMYVMKRIIFLDNHISLFHLYENSLLNDYDLKHTFLKIYLNLFKKDSLLLRDKKNRNENSLFFNTMNNEYNVNNEEINECYKHNIDKSNYNLKDSLNNDLKLKNNKDDYVNIGKEYSKNLKGYVRIFSSDSFKNCDFLIKEDNLEKYFLSNYINNDYNFIKNNEKVNVNDESERILFKKDFANSFYNNSENIDKISINNNNIIDFRNDKCYNNFNYKKYNSDIILNRSKQNFETHNDDINTKSYTYSSDINTKKRIKNDFIYNIRPVSCDSMYDKDEKCYNKEKNDNLIDTIFKKRINRNIFSVNRNLNEHNNINLKTHNLKKFFNFNNNELKILIYNFLYLYIFDEYLYINTHKKDINEYFNFVNVLKRKQKLRYNFYNFLCKPNKDIGDEISYYKKYIKEKYLNKNKKKDNKIYNSMFINKTINVKMRKNIHYKTKNKKRLSKQSEDCKSLKENKKIHMDSIFINNKKNYNFKSINLLRETYRKNFISYNAKINIEKYEHIFFLFLITEMLSVIILPYINFHFPFIYINIKKNCHNNKNFQLDKFRFESISILNTHNCYKNCNNRLNKCEKSFVCTKREFSSNIYHQKKKKRKFFNYNIRKKKLLYSPSNDNKIIYYKKKDLKNEKKYKQKHSLLNDKKEKRNNIFNKKYSSNLKKVSKKYDHVNKNIYYITVCNFIEFNGKLRKINNLSLELKNFVEKNYLFNDYYHVDVYELNKKLNHKGKYFLIKKYEQIIALSFFTRFNTYLIFSLYQRIALLNYLYRNYNLVISILRYINHVHCKLINQHTGNNLKKKNELENNKINETGEKRLHFDVEHDKIKFFFYMNNEDIHYDDYIINTYSTNYINDKYKLNEKSTFLNERKNFYEKLCEIKSFRFSLFFDILFELKVNFNYLHSGHICVQNSLKYLFFFFKNAHKFNLIIDSKQKKNQKKCNEIKNKINTGIKEESGVILSKEKFMKIFNKDEKIINFKEAFYDTHISMNHKNNDLKEKTSYFNKSRFNLKDKNSDLNNEFSFEEKYNDIHTNNLSEKDHLKGEYFFHHKIDVNKLRGCKLYYIIGISLLKQINNNYYYDNIREVNLIYEKDLINNEINISSIVKNDYMKLLNLSYKYIIKSISVDHNNILSYYYLCVIYLYKLKINKCIYICKNFLLKNFYNAYAFPFFLLSIVASSSRRIRDEKFFHKRYYSFNKKMRKKHNDSNKLSDYNKCKIDNSSIFEFYDNQYIFLINKLKYKSPNFYNSITNINDVFESHNVNKKKKKEFFNIYDLFKCDINTVKKEKCSNYEKDNIAKNDKKIIHLNEMEMDKKKEKQLFVESKDINYKVNKNNEYNNIQQIEKNHIIKNHRSIPNKEKYINKPKNLHDNILLEKNYINKTSFVILNKAINFFSYNFFFFYIYVHFLINFFCICDIFFFWEKGNNKEKNNNGFKIKHLRYSVLQEISKKHKIKTNISSSSDIFFLDDELDSNNFSHSSNDIFDDNNENYKNDSELYYSIHRNIKCCNNLMKNRKSKKNKLTSNIEEEIDKIKFFFKILGKENVKTNKSNKKKVSLKKNENEIYDNERIKGRNLYVRKDNGSISSMCNVNKSNINKNHINKNEYIDVSKIKLLPCSIPLIMILYKYIYKKIVKRKGSDSFIYFYLNNIMSNINLNRIKCELHEMNNDLYFKNEEFENSDYFFTNFKESNKLINKNYYHYFCNKNKNNCLRKVSLKNVYFETIIWINLSEILIYLKVDAKLIIYFFNIISTYIEFYLSLNNNNNNYNFENTTFFYNLTHQFMCLKCLYLFYLYSKCEKKYKSTDYKKKKLNNMYYYMEMKYFFNNLKNKRLFFNSKNLYTKTLFFENEYYMHNFKLNMFYQPKIVLDNNCVSFNDKFCKNDFKLSFQTLEKKEVRNSYWPFKNINKNKFITKQINNNDHCNKNTTEMKKKEIKKNKQCEKKRKKANNIETNNTYLDEEHLFNSFVYKDETKNRQKKYRLIKNIKIYLSLLNKIYYNDRKVKILYARYYFLKKKYLRVINILSLLNNHYQNIDYLIKSKKKRNGKNEEKNDTTKSNFSNNQFLFHLNSQTDFMYEYLNIYMYYQSYFKIKNYKKYYYYKKILNIIFLNCPIIPFNLFPFINL
ncbi:conserved Plasmodium protein, unknown function [Plasmodium gallinaceum]|uniref:Uncharacterized protein n=1 Tax=Plasmodium gallinaceum TaxID=5849 RepID=A0A1J1GQI8_PLAGA|nr:conserved Plasmodium protein, unknown function [Plasmodium gallinaceum]CRG94775.1 conserved Plasmodium protein, unknown function [Plasmodium gallinaceum]